MKDEEKIMEIINNLTEQKMEIPVREVEVLASKEGIENVRGVLDNLISQGLIMESKGYISKIVKRLFW